MYVVQINVQGLGNISKNTAYTGNKKRPQKCDRPIYIVLQKLLHSKNFFFFSSEYIVNTFHVFVMNFLNTCFTVF